MYLSDYYYYYYIILLLLHFKSNYQLTKPTPVFLPGESQGWRSLVGGRLWCCTESDMTEAAAAATHKPL